MKTFILCSVLLSSALLIDAGLVRVRRDKPLSNYGSGAIGEASALNPVRTPFGGSSSGSFGGSVSQTSPLRQVAIVSETNNAPGTLGDNSDFDNSFESENADIVVVMKGSYEYIGDDGQTYVVDWIADENGFQPSAAHLPKEVPIPFPEIAEAVAAQIAFAAEEDAANGGSSFNSGSSFNGGFQGQSSGFQGQSSGFQGQSSGFQGQSSGFQGQSSGFQGQSSGFQGQSSGFNSFAAASNNLPILCSVLLSSALLIDAGLVRVRQLHSVAVLQDPSVDPFPKLLLFAKLLSSVKPNNAPGTLGDNSDFDNSFESENGIRQESSGSPVTIGEESVVVMKGSYEYIGDDGQTYVVDWIADENGFQPSAAHLPKEVPIPFPEIAEAVAAQIAFAAEEDAANGGSSFNSGSSFNGGFQGQSSGFQGQSSGFQGGTIQWIPRTIQWIQHPLLLLSNNLPLPGLNPVSTQFVLLLDPSVDHLPSVDQSLTHFSLLPFAKKPLSVRRINPPGTLGYNSDFSYAFEPENGIKQQVVGSTIDVGGKSVVVMKGSYEDIGVMVKSTSSTGSLMRMVSNPLVPIFPRKLLMLFKLKFGSNFNGGFSLNSGSPTGSNFNSDSSFNPGSSSASGSNFNGWIFLNSGSPTGSNFNSDSSFNPGSSTTSIINDDSLLNTGFSSGSNFNVGSSLNSGSHSGSNFNSDSSFNPGASSGSSFNGDSSFNPESSIGSSFNGDSSFNPGSSFNGDSSFNPGSFSDSSFNSGSGNGFQGQFNGFEGQFDEFEGQLDGFEGQFDEFEGQFDGFEGQSSRLNSIGAASRNFPFNTTPILPSYPS
ncbi:unnamed protein product [Lepeophtheirus salmonis]|uniref:(salmon louse) hypothetical protein n=1 Tax=Lepeophtheirus salmonis TaxID=72036 RepID=A0A7R8CM73_LEPSM|nr:unnamed protein product [Lepeophtheirus salmonis]CAF2860336.1 unnamed protein product [Lepeophtheirus salmonis]